jgi:hypothetical protein
MCGAINGVHGNGQGYICHVVRWLLLSEASRASHAPTELLHCHEYVVAAQARGCDQQVATRCCAWA